MSIQTVGPGVFGIFNAAGYRLSETGYGLQWTCGLWGGRQLLFKSLESAQEYLWSTFPESCPPPPEYVI